MSGPTNNQGKRIRLMNQGILMLVVSPIGALGCFAMFTDEKMYNVPMGVMLAVGTIAAVGLGVWLIREARAIPKPRRPPKGVR
jgi:hypothetical protein